jgi:protein-S-isoprenylcysteine O-methyltransferase Ste14
MATMFQILLPLLILAFVIHRGYYARKYGLRPDTLKKREEGLASRIAGVLGILGVGSTFLHAIRPSWLTWASLPIPLWLRWMSVAVALLGFLLLQWAQATLGKEWSDTPRMMKGQALIISGPYRFLRHPILYSLHSHPWFYAAYL